MVTVRPARADDGDLLWTILEPAIRAGETYALPRDMSRPEALAYWLDSRNEVFVAEDADVAVGTYFLRANTLGGGSHVANCGYVTAPAAAGRGVGAAMCQHSLAQARSRGFRAMQYNLVVSTNERAVRLWQRHGFEIVGVLPRAFSHPSAGYTDAYVMFRDL
jgi:ribosomal protein S18 acetylase RimI-like enzyme